MNDHTTSDRQNARLRLLNATLFAPPWLALILAVIVYWFASPNAAAWVAAGGVAWLVLSFAVQLAFAAPLARWLDGE